MALTQTQVSQLYVSIFGRASEGEGNQYWQTNGTSMASAANSMLATTAAQTYFGSSLDSDQSFIEHIYLNTLGKTYAEDKDGIDYWVGRLADGESRGDIIAAMIVAAQSPENAGDAQDQFNNKVEVSDYTAIKIEKAGTDLSLFQNLIKDVTADTSSVTKSKNAVDEEANTEITGEIKYLTVTQDIVDGTAGNDQFVSYVAQNMFGQQVNTLGSGDVINGGAGNDTLDAQVTTGAYVNGTVSSNMAIAPITNSVENVVLHAEIADFNGSGNNDLVIVNAKYMNGVEKIASNYSDASLLIQNMTTKGVSGGTAAQTIAMEYTGNADTNWNESNMTVFYDQDYLTRSDIAGGAELEIRLANLYENVKDDRPIVSFDSITIQLVGKGSIVVDITEAQSLNGDAAYNKIVELMNAAFVEAGWTTVSAKTLAARDLIFSDDVNGGEYTQGDSAGSYLPILVTNTGSEEFGLASFASNNNSQHGNRLETSIVNPVKETDTPVSINVDLEKVGLAADGGALTIGSMNKDGANVFGNNQDITVTETVAGFDEFNVSVAGDKTKNSSLSALQSTDNTLRKVTIDSKVGSTANLIIGNSNTTVTTALDNSADNANAFKDVQIMDASSFAGDLTLNAGFTDEILTKYLNNATETTLYGLNDAKTELASFDYNGGAGNDTLNLALDLVDFAKGNFVETVATEGTNGLNVFKMDINGGAGNDTIIVDADTVNAVGSMTNITINGGLGDDTIDISSFASSWTYNVAFNGTHFGHDTVEGFNVGAVTLTDETQTLDLTDFVAHTGETIVVTVGDKTTTFKAIADMTDIEIATKVAEMLEDPTSNATATQQFTSADNAGTSVVDLTKTDANVNSVTVEIISQVEANDTYDKDTTPIHTATSVTNTQGGLLDGGDAVGADTLDFSAYNVDGVVINNTTTDVVATGSNYTTVGNTFIYLEASAHDATVYNVYEATVTKTGITTVDSIDFTATTGNATAKIIGSINLDEDADGTAVDYEAITASQLLF